MSQQSRTILKSYFKTGDTPTEAEFINLIDSLLNITDDVADRYVKVELSSAQILSSFSSPVEVIPAPGVGKVIVLRLMTEDYTFVSSAYATNTDCGIFQSGQTNNILQAGITDIADLIFTVFNDGGFADLPNTAMDFYTKTGNPTAGDSTMILHIWYKILTL